MIPELPRRSELEQMSKDDLVNALMLAQGQLDSARRIPLGRYAFYHRHLAMRYVRRRDPELANWASVEAGHQIDVEGGKSFEDVVARLEGALQDLLTGAEQQSQSHVDVALKCRAALRIPREFVNARGEIEDEDGNTRQMTQAEREAWESR